MNTQSKDGHKLFFCYYCLQHFISEELNGTPKAKMPCKDKNIFFMNYGKRLIAPFVIYTDFECIIVPINEKHIKSIRFAVIVTK